jgi:hypothetical protein
MPFNLEKARQVHGDRYDYSKAVYVDYATKVEIVCPMHGSFWQVPRKHLGEGRGCIKCRDASMRGSFREAEANKIHNCKYDYSKVAYVNADTKVEIVCPHHGSFLQTPYHHINRKHGCYDCWRVRAGDSRRLTTQEFIANARAVHGDKYDYSATAYVSAKRKIHVICPKHGRFSLTPSNHVHISMGCPRCTGNVSKSGDIWLDSFKNPNLIREHIHFIAGKRFKFDGYDPTTNTVYEYFGYFWHGHPDHTDHSKVNPKTKTTFADLYKATLEKILLIDAAGFNLVYTWGP